MSNNVYSYEDLHNLLKRVYKRTTINSALNIEIAQYPIELYDEIKDMINETEWHKDDGNNI
jgi:hypothetical protein